MVKKLLLILVLLIPYTYSQSEDSLTSKIDSIINDSTIEISDSLSAQDSTIISDIKQAPDTIAPIQGERLTLTSTIINKQTFLFSNYRYTGDLMRSFPLYFIKDQGFVGQPNESFIYGVGNNGVSYLVDGVFWNNRYTNSLDLNHIQSEDVDLIEIVPAPRGFLYGPYNNPVTVNFISRDFISPDPYSRIKYYEGPDGEAMIDGKFNAQIFKRWNLSAQVTNRKYDSSYTNSEFSIWQVNAKLKYFLSNSINISGAYYFVDSRVGLNDGVDVDSISKTTSDINSVLYEAFLAPVVSPFKKLDALQHSFVLKTLAKPFENSKLDFSIYYKYALDEFANPLDSLIGNEDKESKSYGAVLNYYQQFNAVRLQLISSYENIDKYLPQNIFSTRDKVDIFNMGGLLSISFLSGLIVPSIFMKQNFYRNGNFNHFGIGGDIVIKPLNNLVIYGGYSVKEEFIIYKNVPSFESSVQYADDNFKIGGRYFYLEIDNYKFSQRPETLESLNPTKISGLGLTINYKFWLLLLEAAASYYFFEENTKRTYLPDWQFNGGIYVNDYFFDNNLNLKAGFKFYYTGALNGYENFVLKSEPTNKLDFTIAGEIQKTAIFYFVWENLFGNQYFITPYYPMPERNVRFGLAWELFN